MNIETKTLEMEVVQPDDKLVKYANQTGLETTATTSLVDAFKPIFLKARAALADAKGVAESVKDATCVKEIKKSRACRLAIRAVRLESEQTRKKQKEHALIYGKAVDGFHNILLADLSPVETSLQEAEDTAERAEAARLGQLQESRKAALAPLVDYPITGDLSALSEVDFERMLSDAKLLRQAKIEAAAKAEAEAKAKAEAERAERERIAAENARLKAEAEERERAEQAERAEAARKLAEERAAAEAAAKAEREAAARKLAEERAAADAAAKLAAEKARKEREEIEAKAKAERDKALKEAEQARAKAEADRKAREAQILAERAAEAAKAKAEQARLQAIADEQRKKLEDAERSAKALRDAEAKRQAESEAAAKKAAAAPDNSKAQAFADTLRKLPLPKFTQTTFSLLPAKVEALAKWIEAQISTEELL